jgi:MHS family proline/betaine transporter-like MFS transporter
MNKQKLVFSSGIANTFEWYDYALFGHLAPILSAKFFPDTDPSVALLNGFLLFAVGYLMRPLGGIFFGIIGDKLGRRAALSASIICMAFPTALISILPTYDSIGVFATVLMVVVRMLQGLSMGGALTGSVSFLIEHTSKKHRGIAGSVPMASICLGILLGSIVSNTVRSCMSEENFVSWGWRIPFFFGIFIMFAGFYIRKYTQETPLFQEIKAKDQILKSPLKAAVQKHWSDIIISICINSTGSVIFYMQAIYIMNYLSVERGVPSRDISYMVNISYIVMIFATIFSGWLSDIIGRRKIFVINLIAIAFSSFFLMDIFAHGDIKSIWFAQIIFAIFAGTYIGPEPALQAELFPTNVRNTALSLAYNTGTSIFGGTTPYVLYLLLHKTGSINASAYYIIICTILSMTALYFYKDRSG